jgi:hypothetical protein
MLLSLRILLVVTAIPVLVWGLNLIGDAGGDSPDSSPAVLILAGCSLLGLGVSWLALVVVGVRGWLPGTKVRFILASLAGAGCGVAAALSAANESAPSAYLVVVGLGLCAAIVLLMRNHTSSGPMRPRAERGRK